MPKPSQRSYKLRPVTFQGVLGKGIPGIPWVGIPENAGYRFYNLESGIPGNWYNTFDFHAAYLSLVLGY